MDISIEIGGIGYDLHDLRPEAWLSALLASAGSSLQLDGCAVSLRG